MTKALTRLMLAALAASLCAFVCAAQVPAPAQTHAPDWFVVSPAGEGFTARMPSQPVSVAQRVQENGLNASGLRYAAAVDEATTFVVWSMKGSHASEPLGGGDRAAKTVYGVAPYLDEVAELAWEMIVAPEIERLKKKGWWRRPEVQVGMTYVREFAVGGLPAREYSVRLERERGHVYICSEGAQVYVVAALGADAGDARLKQFVDSFALKSAPPDPPAPPKVVWGDATGPGLGRVTVESAPARGGDGGGAGPGGVDGGVAVDYSRPFRQVEVTKKAVITHKPEPGFTEQARRFNVTGVVRLRAILHSSGDLQHLTVVKGLPHGMTAMTVAAANRIRFNPAQKDGRPVSQYVVLEYNFHIY